MITIERTFYDLAEKQQSLDDADTIEHTFTIRLRESTGQQAWRPAISASDFQKLLSNLTAIQIKAITGDVTFLTSFKLGSAIRAESNNPSFV
jgi:hypothetical protein